jgi:hypothetical protein
MLFCRDTGFDLDGNLTLTPFELGRSSRKHPSLGIAFRFDGNLTQPPTTTTSKLNLATRGIVSTGELALHQKN